MQLTFEEKIFSKNSLEEKTMVRVTTLVVSGSYYIVRETASHGHTLLLVDEKSILLDLYVPLQPLPVPQQVLQSLVPLGQLVLE